MDMKEETHFVLRMMKFIFQISGSRLPENLQELLHHYPIEEEGNFNDTIAKAVMILIDDLYSTKKFPPDIGSREFDSIVFDICKAYTHLKFFKFCSSYGLQAALEYNGKKLESPTMLYEAIMRIFETTKKRGLFTDESWDILDKIASKIVADDQEKCRRQMRKGAEMWLDMSSEREFILRTMDHIFSLYFKNVPEYIADKLHEHKDSENNPFTPTIGLALICLMNSQMEVILNLGVEGIEKHFYESVSKSYNERDFLELCVCYSRKAVLDFYEQNKFRSPLKVYDTLLQVLRCVRDKNVPIFWDNMEEVANLIIEENRARTESELECRVPLSSNRSEHIELEEYTPLMRVNEAEGLLVHEEDQTRHICCSCCKCS